MFGRLIVAWTFALATQVLIAQVAPSPADKPEIAKQPPANCAVSGRVVSAADGAPLRSARVGLIQYLGQKHRQIYSAATDSDGHFEIKQIEAGHYIFFASHTGYIEQHYQAKGTEEGAVLSLVAGQEVTDVMFRMVRAAAIIGKVSDDSGEPMAGVGISVLRRPSADELEDEGPGANSQDLRVVSTGRTDDRGEYRVARLEPGEYYVKAVETADTLDAGFMSSGPDSMLLRELGSQYAPAYYPGVLQMEQAQALAVSVGEEVRVDFAMRRIKLVEVSGRVIGIDGSPATNAYARLMPPDIGGFVEDVGSSVDGKGGFVIKGVAPGSYILSVSQSDEGHHYSAYRKIDVGEEKIDSIVIAMSRGARIQGHIIANGGETAQLERIQVQLIPTSSEDMYGAGFARVKKDGTFEMDGIADGRYSVGAYGMEQGWFMKSAHLGSEDAMLQGVRVENGAVAGTLDIVISPASAQIEGIVTDNDKNQPLAGARLRAVPDPEIPYNSFRTGRATTDQNGHFMLKDLPPGKYKITARMPSATAGRPSIKSEPVVVSVAEREHRTVDIKLAIPKSE